MLKFSAAQKSFLSFLYLRSVAHSFCGRAVGNSCLQSRKGTSYHLQPIASLASIKYKLLDSCISMFPR
uniref:Uncharacterized protein n=1 Tax=Arundo donax TaxID=35708 RepID=A0A0A9HKV5_ARUDO